SAITGRASHAGGGGRVTMTGWRRTGGGGGNGRCTCGGGKRSGGAAAGMQPASRLAASRGTRRTDRAGNVIVASVHIEARRPRQGKKRRWSGHTLHRQLFGYPEEENRGPGPA